ncbi:MAG: hypothetical protein HUJ90_04195 [Bacteroidales bacterium]|nr:hypothetical protein [Bacteroidales bacterium]
MDYMPAFWSDVHQNAPLREHESCGSNAMPDREVWKGDLKFMRRWMYTKMAKIVYMQQAAQWAKPSTGVCRGIFAKALLAMFTKTAFFVNINKLLHKVSVSFPDLG